jgi:hypothetical protein
MQFIFHTLMNWTAFRPVVRRRCRRASRSALLANGIVCLALAPVLL